MFCTISAVVFAIHGRMLVVFYKAAIATKSEHKLNDLLSIHHQINAAKLHLKNSFTSILLVNCAHIFFSLIFILQNTLHSTFHYEQVALTVWTTIWITEAVVRLYIICQTADAICQSVNDRIVLA